TEGSNGPPNELRSRVWRATSEKRRMGRRAGLRRVDRQRKRKRRGGTAHGRDGCGWASGEKYGRLHPREGTETTEKNMSITNTKKEADENPLSVLARASVFGASGAIEQQEAAGQRELVNSQQLPVEIINGTEAHLLSMGIELGPLPTGDEDPLFRNAGLPDGWKLKATEHAMWSQLVDDKGRKRASVFYKAA